MSQIHFQGTIVKYLPGERSIYQSSTEAPGITQGNRVHADKCTMHLDLGKGTWGVFCHTLGQVPIRNCREKKKNTALSNTAQAPQKLPEAHTQQTNSGAIKPGNTNTTQIG